jgi:hypothetical protein
VGDGVSVVGEQEDVDGLVVEAEVELEDVLFCFLDDVAQEV